MNFKKLTVGLACALSALGTAFAAVSYTSSTMQPPAPLREFRAAWVATVGNIDWPSKPGLPVEQQKAELIKILDRAVKTRLNAIILQVRPACDAIYPSKIEPWTPFLTGTMGQAPEPFYDPLAFAIEEAHKRGLELHAWFNPYRAGLLSKTNIFSANHISKTHPEMVRKYGSYLWLDPGEPKVQEYSLRVVMDVVDHYNIDGVHFDDYFYPYKEQDAQKRDLDFPDDASWKAHGSRGKLNRDDWRRENVNSFVRRVYESIKSTKPWVKFGIAPFGIWQPGYPRQIKGFNAYEVLYCDSRKWLTNGWMDYCSPQLYWSIDAPEQSFSALLSWWLEQNPKHRNIWPGIDSGKAGGKWKANEIENQIRITREKCGGSAGVVLWSMKGIMQNRGGLGTALASDLYSEPALVPGSPWLESKFPGKPKLKLAADQVLRWSPAGWDKISLWVLQTRSNSQWHTSIINGEIRAQALSGSPEMVAITAVDRCGVASLATVLERNSRLTEK